jgi:hypothetical protein
MSQAPPPPPPPPPPPVIVDTGCPVITLSARECKSVPFIPSECYPSINDQDGGSLYYYDDPIVYDQTSLIYLTGPLPPKA